MCCQSCNFLDLIEEIDSMLNDDNHRWAWAYDSLDGIKDTIMRSGHATENQRRAIENIRRKG